MLTVVDESPGAEETTASQKLKVLMKTKVYKFKWMFLQIRFLLT